MKKLLLSLTAVMFLFSLAYAGDEPKVFTEKDLKKYKSKDDEATQKYNESVRTEQETAKKEQVKAEEKANPATVIKTTLGPIEPWDWSDHGAKARLMQERQRIQQESQRRRQELDNKARSLGIGTVK